MGRLQHRMGGRWTDRPSCTSCAATPGNHQAGSPHQADNMGKQHPAGRQHGPGSAHLADNMGRQRPSGRQHGQAAPIRQTIWAGSAHQAGNMGQAAPIRRAAGPSMPPKGAGREGAAQLCQSDGPPCCSTLHDHRHSGTEHTLASMRSHERATSLLCSSFATHPQPPTLFHTCHDTHHQP